jgi:hypothetical protein
VVGDRDVGVVALPGGGVVDGASVVSAVVVHWQVHAGVVVPSSSSIEVSGSLGFRVQDFGLRAQGSGLMV